MVRIHRIRSSLLNGKQEWSTREKALLGELVAVRAQVDKLLDQQQVLISLLAATAVPGGAATAAGAQPGLQSRGAQLDVAKKKGSRHAARHAAPAQEASQRHDE